MKSARLSFGIVTAVLMGALCFADDEGGSSRRPKQEKRAKSPATARTPESALKYPITKKGDQVDDYHGTKVADPYRWLEDPNSDETKAWVAEQNKVTRAFLDASPRRNELVERLTRLWNYERFGVPSSRGGRYFFSKNDGLQNQSVLYWTDGLESEPKLLLDPNALSSDGTVALSGSALTDDGKLMAYGLSSAGSDWQEWRVRDIEAGRDLEDHLKWIKFSGASWKPDGSGFFYGRYDEPAAGADLTGVNYFQKLYYHALGTPQSQDKLIYERQDHKEWMFSGTVSEDGQYLIISIDRGTERKNQVFYVDLASPEAQVVELISGFEAEYSFVGNDGSTFFLQTDDAAPRYRLIAIDVARPDRKDWREIIPQSPDLLESVSLVGDRFFATSMHDATHLVRMFDLTGKPLGDVALPGFGTVAGFGGKRSDRETFYSFTSFTSPATIYRYDIESGASTVFRQPTIDFPFADYETEQVFYSSKDGTRLPMFIVHKKGMALNGANPTLLYGYGGFNISLTPNFSASRLAWLEMGGVYAVPNLRGGGEYGRDWHESGMLEKKQNVFDDFIAAAEWLIDNKYASRECLAISGGSNGGLLVGACMTQRPELFGAALPAVGVMDMLRYHKFTIGWAWVSEFGSADDAAQFAIIHKYSPLHNLKPGVKYPATLVTTADHDDRVVPAHSFKFAAALQAAQGGIAPTLIRIETSAGHGAGKPTAKLIEETADVYAFLTRVLGAP